MQIFTVGGFVRDQLLRESGYPVPDTGDHDWVVVGATPEEMVRLGYIPVGADFPVFLHPDTHEEYALARTERKTAPGYHGFVFHAAADVTLEEDLKRRDLTINAIALSENGELIDPYQGRKDLQQRILRHVSEAFAEDPVRILRVARFSAKFPDFQIAPETMSLMRRMVQNGETDALVPERVWAEISKGLGTTAPIKMIDALYQCGLWQKLMPVDPQNAMLRQTLDRAVSLALPTEARFALLTSFCENANLAQKIASSLRTPAAVQQLCHTFYRLQSAFAAVHSPNTMGQVLEQGDALRRPERLLLMASMWQAKSPQDKAPYDLGVHLWQSVNAGEIAKLQPEPRLIPHAIRAARIAALRPIFPLQQTCDNGDHRG